MRTAFNRPSMQAIYNGFIDQNPKEGETPFTRTIERAYFDGLKNGVLPPHVNLNTKYPALYSGESDAILAAHYAGVDLHMGTVKRGSTEMFGGWVDGTKEFRLPEFIFGRYSVKRLDRGSGEVIAMRFENRVYYQWGAVEGHAFPKGAIAVVPFTVGLDPHTRHPLPNWYNASQALARAQAFEKASYHTRRHTFVDLLNSIEQGALPSQTNAARIYEKHGELGLIRYYFRGRFSAAAQTPNMQLAQGISYIRIVCGANEYLLCDMDDAIHHLMSGAKCILHDLNTPLEGIDV